MTEKLRIAIPSEAKRIMSLLTNAGFTAYVVGGCVRDSLLGYHPKDWDICTSALPEQMKEILSSHYKVLETGLKHGTLTVVSDDYTHFEVTTYRKDGVYTDGRHPDTVTFVDDIVEDLSRRDFTINSMAYNDIDGLIDPFGGQEDLRRLLIRCVGDPKQRFAEDQLRVLRALRFSSTYRFLIDPETQAAIHDFAQHGFNVSAERIRDELCKMVVGYNILSVMVRYKDVFCSIIPEFVDCIGFNQNNRFHCYTVYDHIAHAVSNCRNKSDVEVEIALLLHDIGKPQCYSEDERGGHFYGHEEKSAELAKNVLERLKFSNDSKKTILELIRYHNDQIAPTKKSVRKWISKLGQEHLAKLLQVKLADIEAHSIETQDQRLNDCYKVKDLLDQIIVSDDCFTIRDLAINGKNIMSLGVKQGPIIGMILNALLSEVLDEKVKNTEEDLSARVKKMINDSLQR